MKLVKLPKMCLHKTQSKSVWKTLVWCISYSELSEIKRSFITIPFILPLECIIRKIQANQAGLKLSERHQLLVCPDDGFAVLTVVTKIYTLFWDVTLCSLVEIQ
jgi:hypothetical protein